MSEDIHDERGIQEFIVKYFEEQFRNEKTINLFAAKDEKGKLIWAKRRLGLHESIIKETIKDGISCSEPIAVFMGGGSASGKSIIRDEIIIPWLDQTIITIDSDIIKNSLPEYILYSNIDSIRAANLVHNESKEIALRILDLCLDSNYSLVYDSTMAAPPQFFIELINKCRNKNYRLLVAGVCTPVEVALKREETRYQRTNRKVEKDALIFTHEEFPKTFFKIKDLFDDLFIFDNSLEPKPVAERHGIGQTLEIYDNILYTRFKERGETR